MGRTKKPIDKKQLVKEKLRLKKKESKKNKHRARLIVRNLPFATSEENLREHFEKYGEIDEVKLLKKEDGKLLGCGFVQFKLVQKAAKARHYLNGKPFLNRDITCEWAIAKNKYGKAQTAQQPADTEEVKIKEEPVDDSYNVEVKTEKDKLSEEQSNNTDVIEEQHGGKIEDSDESAEEEENESVEEKNSDDESDNDSDLKDEEDIEDNKPRVVSNDAVEGRTVFIKNVPFTATDEDVKECMSQFGPLYYALVCVDRMTEHSKGTAFVKFRNKEDADKCLATSGGITLMGNILECHCALTRDDVQRKANEKKDKGPKDSRNLYLVKEGVVLAGTKAAEGVSAADMAKRLQIEQYKTQMLKNLNMIVARTRLIVHNIPENWDDGKLRQLFTKYSNPTAGIKEAKIMRNMRLLDGWGKGKSKGFGFVTFTSHDAALAALRVINNNPNIFSASKRPIVAFSIENRARLQTKERRLQNSRLKNPKCKSYDPNVVKKHTEDRNRSGKRSFEGPTEESLEEYSGVAATPGNKKMRSRFKLNTQAQIHREHLKKQKKAQKHAKKTLQEKQKEFTKQPRQKINKNKINVNDNFSKLVNDYKQKLLAVPSPTKKTKWYEQVSN